jgi:hypothetical protein
MSVAETSETRVDRPDTVALQARFSFMSTGHIIIDEVPSITTQTNPEPHVNGRWKKASDFKRVNEEGREYVPRRATEINETKEERIARIWRKLTSSQIKHAGPYRDLYADRFGRRTLAVGSSFDQVSLIMERFRDGAIRLGIELPKSEVILQPAMAVSVRGADGYLNTIYGKAI